MNTAAFLATLRARDIQVWAEDGQLRCSAPAGTLSPEFREELRQRKAEILRFLDVAETLARQQRAIIPLQPHGASAPVFAVAGHNGDVFCYRTLVRHLGENRPFFGLQPPGLDGHSQPIERVEDLAAYFAKQIAAFRPDGPHIIAGYCAGGAIAFELARQLVRSGLRIDLVALFGAPYATAYRIRSQIRLRIEFEWARWARHAGALMSLAGADRRTYIREKLLLHVPSTRAQQPQPTPLAAEVLARRVAVQRATFAALRRYKPGPLRAPLSLFLPSKTWARSSRYPLRWRSLVEHCQEHYGPEDCHTDVMLLEPYAPLFARLFSQPCAAASSPLDLVAT